MSKTTVNTPAPDGSRPVPPPPRPPITCQTCPLWYSGNGVYGTCHAGPPVWDGREFAAPKTEHRYWCRLHPAYRNERP